MTLSRVSFWKVLWLGITKINSSGDCIDKLCWGTLMNSAGDRNKFGECDLPWLLA